MPPPLHAFVAGTALFFALAVASAGEPAAVNVRDHGAKGDGTTKDHAAIQAAIDVCAARGGGTVLVPAGTYLCGTVELKSRTRLFLDAGAVIAGSPDRADYRKLVPGDHYFTGNPAQPHNRDQGLIVARKATNVGVAGPGTVDARGHAFYDETKVGSRGRFAVRSWRPGPTLLFLDCAGVSLTDFRVRDNPFFAVNLVGCDGARLAGLDIANDHRFQNGDGVHVSRSRRLTITGCRIDTEDDALCFYGHADGMTDIPVACTGVAVSDCVLTSGCSGIRIGYAADGPVADMAFSNIVITRAENGIDFLCTAKNGYAKEVGAAGPTTRDIVFSNVVIAESNYGITANISADARAPGGIRDLAFSNLKVRSRRGNYLAGSQEVPIRNVTFRDADFVVTGTREGVPPGAPDPLPMFSQRTHIPHAFFLRRADGVAFRDCRVHWDGAAGDWGSALHAERCRDLDCRTLRAEPLRRGAGPAVTAADSEVLLPDGGR